MTAPRPSEAEQLVDELLGLIDHYRESGHDEGHAIVEAIRALVARPGHPPVLGSLVRRVRELQHDLESLASRR